MTFFAYSAALPPPEEEEYKIFEPSGLQTGCALLPSNVSRCREPRAKSNISMVRRPNSCPTLMAALRPSGESRGCRCELQRSSIGVISPERSTHTKRVPASLVPGT